MNLKWKSFDDLSFNAARYLISKMGRTQGTAKQYVCFWRRIKRYMNANKIRQFDSSVGKAYLMAQFGNHDYSELSKSQKDFIRAVRVLSEFSDKGSIRPVKEQVVFHGPIGAAITAYLSFRISLRLNKHTVEEGEQHLYRFFNYLTTEKIDSIKKISHLHILKFIKTIDSQFTTLPHRTIESIRGFLKYAHREKLIVNDLAVVVPKYNYIKQPKLPSVYSTGEIQKIIASIDRGNAVGKRNYAIVLLAARLGLRASDIANIKFENLNWDKSAIVLNQYKTGKKIELPILSDVGNAIVDYLKYSRPKSSERLIFLTATSPYRPVQRGAITGIVHSYFVKAGINITQRKHGPHALRHSLASILLEKQTVLPVISEVLGHQDTASTTYYLRIDLKSMSKCPLDVPPVSSSFYQQKGGYFYA
ncbi:MAG: site-specific integrase [Ferruginibacter sp.]